NITIDKTAPIVAITTVNGTARTFPLTTNATTTSVGGTCGTVTGDIGTVSIAVTGGSSQNGTAPCSSGAWTFSFATALSAEGAYNITTTQTDGAGNIGTTGAQTITIDKTPPIVSIASVNASPASFPLSTNGTVTSVGGACGILARDAGTVSVSVTGGST